MTAIDKPSEAMPSGGLRERKKQRTRETIIRCALELFQKRGFEATTIHDIAAAADIAPRTFFSYFPSKEAVVFHDFDAVFAAFRARLDERPPEETALEAMRAWLLDWLEARKRDLAHDEARRCIVESTPALESYERTMLARFQDELAHAIARDLGVPDDSLRPHMAAAAAVAAIEAAGRHAGVGNDPSAPAAATVLDEALAFLHGGLDALRERSPGGA